MPCPGRYSLIRQWFGAKCGALLKMLSALSRPMGRESRRGITRAESQVGSGASRRVLFAVSTEG